MARHELTATRDTVIDHFDRDTDPVLTIDPGDTVVVGSLDANGYLEPMTEPGRQPPTMFAGRRGHCLTGPIAVHGTGPGQALAVTFTSLRPADWGWTVAGHKDNTLTRRLGVAGDVSWLLWDIDSATAKNNLGHTVRTAPFLGVVGVAPAEPGEHSTIPPRARSGGNIDCRDLTAGSTLYLPVNVDEALLYLGDGHAAQGDGEVAGTAIECPMTTEVVVDVADDDVPGVHAVTPTARITFGFNADLNEATVAALDNMLVWMQGLYALDKSTALALASPTVDLRITQVANNTWGVHAVLPHDAIQS
ncbi:acetamidase/formamidase family protein [Kibdelosporangium lantanae]